MATWRTPSNSVDVSFSSMNLRPTNSVEGALVVRVPQLRGNHARAAVAMNGTHLPRPQQTQTNWRQSSHVGRIFRIDNGHRVRALPARKNEIAERLGGDDLGKVGSVLRGVRGGGSV
jgi:hypothetical protein